MKNTEQKPLPSCSLDASGQGARFDSLRQSIFQKVVEIRELDTGYDLVFQEPLGFSVELLEVVNFERQCCAAFTWALVFEPFNRASHLQVYGSEAVKAEMLRGFEAYGLDKLIMAE